MCLSLTHRTLFSYQQTIYIQRQYRVYISNYIFDGVIDLCLLLFPFQFLRSLIKKIDYLCRLDCSLSMYIFILLVAPLL